MKIRKFSEKNYKAIYLNGKTLRIALDPKKPIEQLDFPEFYDVKITDYCTGGCKYCYQNSTRRGMHFYDIIGKTKEYFGIMSENNKPFQVAIGGGNPNEHPDFIELLKTFYDMGITPNYTTNGIGLFDNVVEATKEYCGGVALSCHKQLEGYWRNSLVELYNREIKTNLHLVISDKESIDYFVDIYNSFKNNVDYFVLLPYEAMGRATKKNINYEYLMEKLIDLDSSKIAFGANFYDFLRTSGSAKTFDISLYEPEIMSGYLDMSNMKLYKSSFNLTER